MSLDVYLTLNSVKNPSVGEKIFIREGGQNKEISRAEWNVRFPDREPVVLKFPSDDETVYDANITHNLGKMADAAEIYYPLWRPEEIGVTKACELIEPLKSGLYRLKNNPDFFKKFNPENGWGNYEGFVEFVQEYLDACENNPDADVWVSR